MRIVNTAIRLRLGQPAQHTCTSVCSKQFRELSHQDTVHDAPNTEAAVNCVMITAHCTSFDADDFLDRSITAIVSSKPIRGIYPNLRYRPWDGQIPDLKTPTSCL
jgi:hypothetical protein